MTGRVPGSFKGPSEDLPLQGRLLGLKLKPGSETFGSPKILNRFIDIQCSTVSGSVLQRVPAGGGLLVVNRVLKWPDPGWANSAASLYHFLLRLGVVSLCAGGWILEVNRALEVSLVVEEGGSLGSCVCHFVPRDLGVARHPLEGCDTSEFAEEVSDFLGVSRPVFESNQEGEAVSTDDGVTCWGLFDQPVEGHGHGSQLF